MKKGKIIQDIKTNTSLPVLISTLFYVFLTFLFVEGGLWLGSELVGPFSLVIEFLTELFHQEMEAQVFKSFSTIIFFIMSSSVLYSFSSSLLFG